MARNAPSRFVGHLAAAIACRLLIVQSLPVPGWDDRWLHAPPIVANLIF
jgi:hypothetical protein